MKQIKIKLISYDSEIDGKELCYCYDENTLIIDLYKYIENQCGDEPHYNDDEYINRFAFVVNGENKRAYTDYSLDEFLQNWMISIDDVSIMYPFPCGIGGGCEVEKLAKIRINPRESIHRYLPHVHVMRINTKSPQYRISLVDFKELDTDKEKWEKSFNKKQRKRILEILEQNQNVLVDYYNRIQKGEYIMEGIEIFVDGKMIEFW